MADDHNPLDLSDDDLALGELMRSLTVADTRLEAPPADVWAGIEARLADDATSSAAAPTNVVDLASARNRRFSLLLSAAAVVLIGVLATVVLTGNDDEGDVTELASASLAYSDGPGFIALGETASAETLLVEDEAGERRLVIDSADLPATDDGFYELWLLAPAADGSGLDGLVSLGVIDESSDEFAWPAGIDPSVYSAVDISLEAPDGDPAHSGESLIRGGLASA